MKSYLLLVMALVAVPAFAKEPRVAQSGKLVQMESVSCGVDESDKSSHKKTHELLCQEYTLQTDKVVYRIRPRDEKHAELLPMGEQAQFHMEKNKIVLHVEGLDNKTAIMWSYP